MIGKIKAWAAGLLAIVSAVLFGLWQMTRAVREKERRQSVEDARNTERKATAAVIDGEKKIHEAANAKVDTRRRDHFDRD